MPALSLPGRSRRTSCRDFGNRRASRTSSRSSIQTARTPSPSVCGIGKRTRTPIVATPIPTCSRAWRQWLRERLKFRPTGCQLDLPQDRRSERCQLDLPQDRRTELRQDRRSQPSPTDRFGRGGGDEGGGLGRPLTSRWRPHVMTTATKTKLKVFPLADRVAIRPLEETEEMKGGLYIPDTAKEKPIQGEVIAVGPGRLEKGQRVPMELKVGDRVVYGKYTGSQVELDEEEIILIKESDVIAKLS